MRGSRTSPAVLGTCAALLVIVQAGPLLRFPRESEDYPNADFSNYTANEVCFSDQKVFQRGEEVPNAGPCEECRCEPPSIVCQMIKCPVNNNGCRTIQRPNHCCPDYNCECDYNGQLYNDGERIDLPEDPCQVCYCKGGDVMCTSITCYQRDDCEPKHVPGQCCPKFEDCPIRDMEASNTEDKNVQTRSPNKTMNSNPKKEMQPWLLTKSVPQTSSSLAIPKLGETTTDSGNAIIVSDWLVERKTTQDFNTKQTEDPDLSTHQEFTTTIQPQKPTKTVEKESNFEKSLQTVKPTPVDEVVFTRIDIPKRIQEEINDSPTTTTTTTAKNNTSNVSKHHETIKDLKIESENTSKLLSNSSSKYSEEKAISANKTDVNQSSSIHKEKESTTMYPKDFTGDNLMTKTFTVTEKTFIKLEPTKDNDTIETATPDHYEMEVTKSSLNLDENNKSQQTDESTQNRTVNPNSNTTLVEHFEILTNLTQDVTVSDDKDRSPEEMTLEHLFGLEELEDSESTKQLSTSTVTYKTANTLENTILTTLPANIKKLVTVEKSKSDKLKNEPTTENIKLEEINRVANNGSNKKENSPNLDEVPVLPTTETSYSEEETTTYFSSKLSVNKLPLQSDKFEFEGSENYEETTYLPETTTEIETSTLFVVTAPKQLNDEANKKVMDNFIEGKQEGNTDFDTKVDTTTSTSTDNSGFTDAVTSESKTSPTSERFLLNTESILNKGNYKNNVQEKSSQSYTSKENAFTDSTSTPDYKEKTKSTASEIEIVLEETNNTHLLDKSVSSHESNEQDEIILDLALDEISSENKEVIHANHPPVLELNSHVPFLQIGGDDNSESSESEYSQTTEVNKPVNSIVDNFNKNVVNRDKEIIKLVQNKEQTNLSSAVTSSTTTAASSSTKKASDEKAEEFTIPTIAVVPLTPGDLKMIAEYLISEKIKPTSSKNSSVYSPNQWLKGNLTSEENIASILSAANVSIGLMNETNLGRKLETFNKSNQTVQLVKSEKETRHKSNSILKNNSFINSKTDYLHDKNSDNQETFKTTITSQDKRNDVKTSEDFSIEETVSGFKTTTIKPLQKTENRSEQDFEHSKNLKTEKMTTEINYEVGTQKSKLENSLKILNYKTLNETKVADKTNDTLRNILETDNLITREKKKEQENIQTISKHPAPGEKPSDSPTTSKSDQKSLTEPITKSPSENEQNETAVVDVRKTENLVTSEKKVDQATIQDILHSVSGEKHFDSPTTNKLDTTTSKILIDKPPSDGISS